MEVPFIDIGAQYKTIKSEIDQAIQQVLEGGQVIGGEEVHDFEKKFAEKSQVKHCISMANGTDALWIALKALGIGKGDEVITTALSWISSASTILQAGATPVFVDIDISTGLIDTDLIEDKITNKTKAIIPVHLHGQMVDMIDIRNLCDRHKLYCIEDSAQAHFASFRDVMPSQMSDMATFSFYPTKNLGAYGDAGCIVTNDYKLEKQCRALTNYGNRGEDKQLGINSRMDSIQAAILNVKMKYVEGWIEQKRSIADRYDRLLIGVQEITTPSAKTEIGHTYYTYPVRCKNRNKLKEHLIQHGVQTTIHYSWILPLLPLFKDLNNKEEDFPVAYRYQNESLCLPIFPELAEHQQDYVVSCIKDFYN